MKKLKMLSMFFAALLILSHPALAKEKEKQLIGYANLQRALNECDAGKKAVDALKEEAKKLEEALNERQEELKKMKDEMDKKSSVWNKDVLEAKDREFKGKSQEFQKQFMEYNDQLNKKKQEREEQIINELRDIVEEIAKQKGYSYIFERSVGGILYAPPEADITDEIIKTHNKRVKQKKD